MMMSAHSFEPSFDRHGLDLRYDLLMAVDHLLEGAQLYAKAARDAECCGESALTEYFRNLERTSRRQAQLASELLDRQSKESALLTAPLAPVLTPAV